MSQAAKKKIVVAGGNGFLGSRICKSAVARGWDVTSIRYVRFDHFLRNANLHSVALESQHGHPSPRSRLLLHGRSLSTGLKATF